MPRPTTLLTLAALAAVPPLAGPARAEAPAAPPVRTQPPLPTMWTEPPEAVRGAVAALRDACAAWRQEVPLPTDASADEARRDKPFEAEACDAALNPDAHRAALMVAYGVLVAGGVGVAIAAFVVAGGLVRMLGLAFQRARRAARDLRAQGRHGWQE